MTEEIEKSEIEETIIDEELRDENGDSVLKKMFKSSGKYVLAGCFVLGLATVSTTSETTLTYVIDAVKWGGLFYGGASAYSNLK